MEKKIEFTDSVLIAGKKDSTALKYAEEHNCTFVELSSDNRIPLQNGYFKRDAESGKSSVQNGRARSTKMRWAVKAE